MKFKVFTSTFKYRNDIDVIGVRANCTFIGYEDSDFNGDQMILPAEPFDRSLSVKTFVMVCSIAFHCIAVQVIKAVIFELG